MTTPPATSLTERIEQALRDAAHVCEDICQPDYDCAEHEPVEATTVHTNGVIEEVRGAVEALAIVAAAAVQPELDSARAENDRLREQLAAVLAVCDSAEHQATRWADPLPVPEWVSTVRAAARTAT